jgi:hypothetical protein
VRILQSARREFRRCGSAASRLHCGRGYRMQRALHASRAPRAQDIQLVRYVCDVVASRMHTRCQLLRSHASTATVRGYHSVMGRLTVVDGELGTQEIRPGGSSIHSKRSVEFPREVLHEHAPLSNSIRQIRPNAAGSNQNVKWSGSGENRIVIT